jgi:ribosomal protein L29
MKFIDLKEKNETQLKASLVELREQERKIRFSISNNQQKNVKELRVIKKQIARVETKLTQLSSTNQPAKA